MVNGSHLRQSYSYAGKLRKMVDKQAEKQLADSNMSKTRRWRTRSFIWTIKIEKFVAAQHI